MSSRRNFLRSVAGFASLGLADVTSLGGLAAFAAEPPAPDEKVRFGPDIEPIVALIEETSRERCVPALIDELRRGLPYRRFLAGVFFAGIRRLDSGHDMYKIQPVHQVSLDLRPEERLLPLFWAVDGFKQRQAYFPSPTLSRLRGALPQPEQADAELARAFAAGDFETAERALVVLARNQSVRQTMETLRLYSCRNGGLGGHGAIVVSNGFRALEVIGWQQAEPALRFILRDVERLGGHGKPDQYFEANLARADRHVGDLPAGWATGSPNRAATLELFALLRAGKPQDACDLVVRQLADGAGSQALWDAVHLSTAELMVRGASGWGIASRPLHSNTSIGALHHAYLDSAVPRTQLLLLLQAVAWAGDKTAAELRDKSLRDLDLTQLPRAAVAASTEQAVAGIFEMLPLRHYQWNDRTRQGETSYGNRSDADEACRRVFSLTQDRPEAASLFVEAALSWLCRKASEDAHDYKFAAAILEESEWVSPDWKPHLLAAAVHYLHGPQSPDHGVVQQARDALRQIG